MFERVTKEIGRWLTLAAQRFSGQLPLEEVIVSQAIAGRLRFAPYCDPREGETPAMRASYRSIVKEPTIKSCLDTIIGGVAAGDITVPPAGKNLVDKKVAEYCQDLTRDCEGGMIGITTAIVGNGLIEGYVVCEPKWGIYDNGPWKGSNKLVAIKPKPTDDYWLEVDKFWNVTGVRVRLTQDLFPVDQFIFWRHQNYSNSPHGTSLLRSVYRSAWMLDTVWQLRGIGLERYTLPVLVGKYPMGQDSVKSSVQAAMKRMKGAGYAVVPAEAAIEPLQMAMRGASDFEAATKDLKEEVCIGMLGASLQTLQGFTPGGRGNSNTHMSVVDTRIWMYGATLCEIIHRQIYTPAVRSTFGPDVPVPWPVLGGLNDDEVKKSLDLDEQLQRMGYPVSISGISERTRRSPGVGEDILKPAAPQGGGMGGPLGDLMGGGSPPPMPPTPGGDAPLSPPPIPSAPEPFSERNAPRQTVIINVPGTGAEATAAVSDWVKVNTFSAQDWTGPHRGTRGGTYWQNTRTGEKKYQTDNPGGSGEAGAAQEQTRPRWQNPDGSPVTSSGAVLGLTPDEREAWAQAMVRTSPAARAQSPEDQQRAQEAILAAATRMEAAQTEAGDAPAATPSRTRERPQPENWATPVIPGRPVRPDRDGNPTWNSATMTGLGRATPILDDVRGLMATPDNITDADVQRVIDNIANISGRDALYTVSVALGIPGSLRPQVVAQNASVALNPFRPWPDAGAAPLEPAARTRVSRAARAATPAAPATAPAAPQTPQQPAAAPTPTPAAVTPPAAPETPAIAGNWNGRDGEGKLKITTQAKLGMSDATKTKAKETLRRILGSKFTSVAGHLDAEQVLATMIGAPNFVEPQHVSLSVGTSSINIRISHPRSGLVMERTIGKMDDGRAHIHNDYFRAGDGNRGDGFGYDCFTRQAAAAQALGFAQIDTHAAGNWQSAQSPDGFNGYYTWARFGYSYPVSSMGGDLQRKIREKYPNARNVQDIVSQPDGGDWWYVNGQGMGNAIFDLTPGSRAWQVNEQYKVKSDYLKSLRKDIMNKAPEEEGKITHDGVEYKVLKVGDKVEVRMPNHVDKAKAFLVIKPGDAAYQKFVTKAVAPPAPPPPPERPAWSSSRQPSPSSRATTGAVHDDHPINHGDLTVSRASFNALSREQQGQWRQRVRAAYEQNAAAMPRVGTQTIYNGELATIRNYRVDPANGPMIDFKLPNGTIDSNVPISEAVLQGYRPKVLRDGDTDRSASREGLSWRYRISDAVSTGELRPEVGHPLSNGRKISAVNLSGPGGRPRYTIVDSNNRVVNQSMSPSELIENGWAPPAPR